MPSSEGWTEELLLKTATWQFFDGYILRKSPGDFRAISFGATNLFSSSPDLEKSLNTLTAGVAMPFLYGTITLVLFVLWLVDWGKAPEE